MSQLQREGDRTAMLHLAYHWRDGTLDPLEGGLSLLALVEEAQSQAGHVRSYMIDTPESRFGASLYALSRQKGFVVELVWVDGTSTLVLFDEEGPAADFLFTRGMPLTQAAVASSQIPRPAASRRAASGRSMSIPNRLRR